jgi:hypothetical protein
MTDEMRKTSRAAAGDSQVEQLEDDGRCWCGIRTYITGPAVVNAGHAAEYKSNVVIDSDPGCKSAEVDEVLWSITDAPAAFKDLIHVAQQTSESCRVKVEPGVQSGTQFTLHATPKGHAVGKGTNPRVACQVNKADAQVISVS